MELKTTRGIYTTLVLLNMYVLLQALPMSPNTVKGGDKRDGVGTGTSGQPGPSVVPVQFKKYAEIFDIIAKLEALQQEVNNVHPAIGAEYKDSLIETKGSDIDLFYNQPPVGTYLDSLRQPMVNNQPLMGDEEDINILDSNTNMDADKRNLDLYNEVVHALEVSGDIEGDSSTLRKRSVDLSNIDLSNIIGNICTTAECLKQLEQFVAWRQAHGYPGYTGVWKVGK